ncbi:hypothetical protein BST61_g7549 [Cercospora zeina]
MEREQYAELPFSPLGYEDGLEEIDRFYRNPEPESQRQHGDVSQVLDEDKMVPDVATEDEFSILQDLEAMEGIEATGSFGPALDNSIVGEDERDHESSASATNNTAAWTKATPPALLGQTPKASSPTIPSGLFAPVKTTPGLSHDPIPPSSSNRSEMQAEMRDGETKLSSNMSTPEPVPFSLPQTNTGANSKRNASASPLATRRPAKKAKDADLDSILAGSPGANSKSPFPAAQHAELAGGTAQREAAEGGAVRPSLVVTMPLPKRTRHGTSLASKDEPTDVQTGTPSTQATSNQEALDAKPQNGTSRSVSKEKGTQDDDKSTASAAPNLPSKPPARVRRTMGAHELKDILDTDSRKGVAGNMSPRRMTRGQKQERDAARPNAKEAVKRRRQASGK